MEAGAGLTSCDIPDEGVAPEPGSSGSALVPEVQAARDMMTTMPATPDNGFSMGRDYPCAQTSQVHLWESNPAHFGGLSSNAAKVEDD
ncbi:hypothetical protein SK1NUM_21100 [Arachnia rubra]|nr:hypothetical protein SK1NUM_21100 [Arachnia rubra]